MGAFNYKLAPIPTYCLFVKSQRDTVPYIETTSEQCRTYVIAIVVEMTSVYHAK